MAKKLSFLPQVSQFSESIFIFCILLQKLKEWHLCEKNYQKGPYHAPFHLPLQAFVAATCIMKLRARAGIIFHNCEKFDVGNPQNR